MDKNFLEGQNAGIKDQKFRVTSQLCSQSTFGKASPCSCSPPFSLPKPGVHPDTKETLIRSTQAKYWDEAVLLSPQWSLYQRPEPICGWYFPGQKD